ncbi:ANKS1A [Symbiodinium natans]|uniref:ANKS1A protein n=1 Tax=Symbiodinium natans TaxID=878477 RepID=A0A812JED0_9DINO|nr:ANKS1A [Symbiodinium natans]
MMTCCGSSVCCDGAWAARETFLRKRKTNSNSKLGLGVDKDPEVFPGRQLLAPKLLQKPGLPQAVKALDIPTAIDFFQYYDKVRAHGSTGLLDRRAFSEMLFAICQGKAKVFEHVLDDPRIAVAYVPKPKPSMLILLPAETTLANVDLRGDGSEQISSEWCDAIFDALAPSWAFSSCNNYFSDIRRRFHTVGIQAGRTRVIVQVKEADLRELGPQREFHLEITGSRIRMPPADVDHRLM